MSRKKHKDITKSIITDTQLQEIIRTNEEIRKLKITHKPFTDNQKKFLDVGLSESTKLMFVNGPAGSAKTYISIYCGLQFFNNGVIEELVYIRNAVESSDHKLGFLPEHKKIKCPYLEPMKDKLEEFLDIVDIKYLQEEERIYGLPLVIFVEHLGKISA